MMGLRADYHSDLWGIRTCTQNIPEWGVSARNLFPVG